MKNLFLVNKLKIIKTFLKLSTKLCQLCLFYFLILSPLEAAVNKDVAALKRDTAESKRNVAELKKDTAESKRNVADLKRDVAALKKDASELKILLEPIHSLQADFNQIMLNEQGHKLLHAKGKMWLKKPGQFRWEVKGADPRLVVSNGKQIWDYDKELEQVTIQRLSQKENKAPIFFLTGDVKTLEKDFKIRQLDKNHAAYMKNNDVCFELQPTMDQSPFQVIRLGFKNKQLQVLEIIDQLGQKSTFNFENMHSNLSLDANLFTLQIPKGVDVVRNE